MPTVFSRALVAAQSGAAKCSRMQKLRTYAGWIVLRHEVEVALAPVGLAMIRGRLRCPQPASAARSRLAGGLVLRPAESGVVEPGKEARSTRPT